MMKKTWIVLILMLTLLNINASAEAIKTGSWKFMLKTTHAEIPFIVDFYYKKNVLLGTLYNGKETIPLTDIYQKGQELRIPIASYQLSFELQIEEKKGLTGYLVRHNKNPVVKTPVVAVAGISSRYNIPKGKPEIDMSGKWSLILEDDQGQKSPGLGNFIQTGNTLSGSILTPTGDYRYLDGYVKGNRFEAASFDGVYNYIFKGEVSKGNITAQILSNSKTKISGQADPKAELPDAYKQTELKELKFIFPNLKGQNVSLKHAKFKNKPVVVQIFGSWCPNCMDEMNYLIPWYYKNHKRGVEIVALAFERSLSPEDAKIQLLKVQKKFKVPYPILLAGSTSEEKPMEKILGLKNFISFPTTIFLNKKHEVVKVHAGFSGPSTGEFFTTWKKEFNNTVDGLLSK